MENSIQSLLDNHKNIITDPDRATLIRMSLEKKEALQTNNGALATWTPTESTGRSPKDTVVVKREISQSNIDWDSPNNIPIAPETFEMLLQDALSVLTQKAELIVSKRAIGANPQWALPVTTITDKYLHALFADNMFRPYSKDMHKSVFQNEPFTLIALPYDKLDFARYDGKLRYNPALGHTTNLSVAIDFDNRIGIVYGSAYCGSMKKLIFTVANYYLPDKGILPLHCSANQDEHGHSALLLGLSGTGKTTLSADPSRALLGDDEHGWSDDGIANFENGCYAKLINLDPQKEPEIFHAVFHEDTLENHGAIIENAMMYPNGEFDLDDERLTPNSRASYPLSFLSNVLEPPVSTHPETILFLTADANGVLPPIAKLDKNQAMLWFLMGYTSKLAGTETGIVEPVTVFSRFFGEPFMPRNPDTYARMLGEKLDKFNSQVFLINTGWSGGPFGVGKRMDISLTRELVNAALSGALKNVEYKEDPLFHIYIPMECPGITDCEILQPRNTWRDPEQYDRRAKKLAQEFREHFKHAYGSKHIAEQVAQQCPGK